jgi:hypothetical protein
LPQKPVAKGSGVYFRKSPEVLGPEESFLPGLPDQRKEACYQFHPHRRIRPAFPLQSDTASGLVFGGHPPDENLGLDFTGRIHGEHSFFGEPGEQHGTGVKAPLAPMV